LELAHFYADQIVTIMYEELTTSPPAYQKLKSAPLGAYAWNCCTVFWDYNRLAHFGAERSQVKVTSPMWAASPGRLRV